MPKSTFVYVTYIAASAEAVWNALLEGEFTRQYWGHENVSDWKPGSPWEHRRDDAARSLAILGEVIEARPPHRLVITWADPVDQARKDRHSRVTFDLEPVADMVRLTVTHDDLLPGSDMERKITQGWPRVLSSLKSLLETGRPLQTWARPATDHLVVSHDEWLAARHALLEKEKAFTHAGDELSRLQRSLPWERVTKEYVFEGPTGRQALADLFAGRSQLIVYHFMFHPDDKAGCPHCSLRADGFNGIGVHLNRRDVTMVVVSRAPYPALEAYRKRMGWSFTWVSSGGSDFNRDYQVSFTPEEMAAKRAFYNYTLRDPKAREREGHSIFYKDQSGAVFHTYSCYDRGNDKLNIHYHYLDLVPKGRDEDGRGPSWVRRRDEYGR